MEVKQFPFALEDYVQNAIASGRMKAHFTQQQLAEHMGVMQACISKIEHQNKVTPALLEHAIKATRRKSRVLGKRR